MHYSVNIPYRNSVKTGITEEFTLKDATSYGGANLYVDYLQAAALKEMFTENISIEKAPYSTYTMSDICMHLTIGYTLGKDRILQFEDLENDPLISEKLGLPKLPDYSLLYKDLRRFNSKERVEELIAVNNSYLRQIPSPDSNIILDYDSSVTTMYGSQDNADKGYNPTKPGRLSYHPIFCFEAVSKMCLSARLRRGSASNSTDFEDFYNETKKLLPTGIKPSYVRMDSGFAGERVYGPLEEDEVGYVGKLKMTDRLRRHAASHPFKRVEYTDKIVEVTSFYYKATTWKKKRRVVIVRTRDPHDNQLLLSDEFGWDYRAMVTNLDWDGEDIWRFYNQRCGSENYIKELKEGFAVGNYPTDDFWPNAADLILKVIAYNCLNGYKLQICTGTFQNLTVERMRRYLLRIPAVLRKHARRLKLKLAKNYRFQDEYREMRIRLEAMAFT